MSSNSGNQTQFKDLNLVHKGKSVILPAEPKPMEIREAVEFLEMKEQELETTVTLDHTIDCFPLDGAVAFHRALLERCGHTIGTKTPPKSMFEGASPPKLISVDIGFNEKIQVSWGSVKVPNMSGRFETEIPANPKSGPAFVIGGEIKKKDEKMAAEITAATIEMLRKNSIYRGKAIRVGFEYLREERQFDPKMDSPTFIDTSNIDPESLILPEKTAKLIEQGLFLPIQKTQQCRDNSIPLKRGVLLTGPYGCGKTLTANVTAKLCEENGWTFLYLKDVRDLALALKFARLYSPCVIFAEDVDQATGGGRGPELNEILNTLDGVDYKDQEIITVLTTNHVENINKAFLRPGRLDTVVPVEPPDQDAAERLILQYGRNLLSHDCDIPTAAEALKGQIPATIRECVERAKLIALTRSDEIKGKVMQQDLIDALEGMGPHMRLMHDAPADGPSQLEFATSVLGQSLGAGIAKNMPIPLQILLGQFFERAGFEAGGQFSANGSAPHNASQVINGQRTAGNPRTHAEESQAPMPDASKAWGQVNNDHIDAAETTKNGGSIQDAADAIAPKDEPTG